MKELVLHLRDIGRRFNHPLQVGSIGYLPDNWHNNPRCYRHAVSFGLVLSSTGTITKEVDGDECSFNPPYAGLSLLGATYQNLSAAHWEEMYFSYDAELEPVLRSYGFVPGERREIRLTERISALVKDILRLCGSVHLPGNADRLDCLCETLMVECMLEPADKAQMDGKDIAVSEIASFIDLHFLDGFDLGALLKKHGLGYRTFLRAWTRRFGVPPRERVIDLKVAAAQRTLEESDLRIDEVAYRLNFQDPLYFSRIFRQKTGMSPSEYRKARGLTCRRTALKYSP